MPSDEPAAEGQTATNGLVLGYVATVGGAIYLFGYVDALFFKPPEYTLKILGMTLGREDMYFGSLTLFFGTLCAAFALAARIGASLRPGIVRMMGFTAVNVLLFSIWLWALSWMQLSDAMRQPSHLLDLWRFGPVVVWVNTGTFPAVIAVSAILHAFYVWMVLKRKWLHPL